MKKIETPVVKVMPLPAMDVIATSGDPKTLKIETQGTTYHNDWK